VASFQPPVAYDNPSTLPDTKGPAKMLFERLGAQPRGRSVLRTAGVYATLDYPTTAQINAATEAYIGGHIYDVDNATVAALVAAGYIAGLTGDVLLAENGSLLVSEAGDFLTEF